MQLSLDCGNDAGMMELEVGKAGEVTIDLARLPQASLDYIFAYGLKQCLADAHSGKPEAECAAYTLKKLDALYAGTVRIKSGRTSDPVKILARAMAETDWKSFAKGEQDAAIARLMAKDSVDDKEARKRIMAALAERNMDKAKAQLASQEDKVDLASLGF